MEGYSMHMITRMWDGMNDVHMVTLMVMHEQ